jgi:hypothetical protein
MKLFQKILSHGLLIAFFLAAFLLYLYRDEIVPQWFGEDVQPVAARSGTGAVERVEEVQTTPQRPAAPAGGMAPERARNKSAATAVTDELPSLTAESDAQPEPRPPAEAEGSKPSARPAPVAGAAADAEEARSAPPGTTGASERSAPAVASGEAAGRSRPAQAAEPKAPGLPPLVSTGESVARPGTGSTSVSELPPLADTAEPAETGTQAPAAPELPPVAATAERPEQEQTHPTGAPEMPPLADTSGEGARRTQQPGSGAATELPPVAGTADQTTGQTPQNATPLVELPPAAGGSRETGPPGKSAPGESAHTAPAAGAEPGEEAPQATTAARRGAAAGSPAETPVYRDQPSGEPAITWEPPRQPLQGEYPPLHKPRRSEAGWPPASSERGDGDVPTATQAASPQYRPEEPSSRPAPRPGDVPRSGAGPAPVAPAVAGPDYQQGLAEARQRFWAQDLSGAVSVYENLTRAYPDRADAWGELGNVKFRLGQWSAAADAYYTAISLLADQGEDARARQLLKILHGLDAEKASELEERLR